MFILSSWLIPNFVTLLDLFAQVETEEGDKIPEIVAELTTWKVVQGLLILFATYTGLWVIDKLIHWLSEKVPLRFRLSIKQSLPFWRAFLIGLAGIVLVNMFLELSPSNVFTVAGTVSVALGFAFKDYASSLIAGVIALFESPYQVGDRIQIGEHYGEIVRYGLRGILIQTPDDNMVTIPHNKIWTDAIVNSNKGNVEAQTIVNFYLGHQVDFNLVTRILYEVAYTSKYTQLKLPVLVIMEEKPWGTHFKLKCYPMDARDEFIYQTDLTRQAKEAFAKYNVSYPKVSAADLSTNSTN